MAPVPGKRGLTKVLVLEVVLGFVLVVSELVPSKGNWPIRTDVTMAMVMLMIYGSELGGLASNMKSELDPFLARLGVGAVGDLAFAGTIRTELLSGDRVLSYDPATCEGCRSCFEVCPQGVWEFDRMAERALFTHKYACTACRACLVQCEGGAIQAPRRDGA